ncbi:hypothetical protein PVAP13_8KG317500 [Panicum virgatum]|uniref:Uncharacterized protein n=1 Tax=Panicum virgatum TaxID=38727 RepID=A0A8T0PMV4_PANVG|nr:hypothetical protein PVAP13_8KG317500 [Panicum virgatum]
MSARSCFLAAMFLLLIGIFQLHAPRAMADSAPGCTKNPNHRTVSCPRDPPNQLCNEPPCPNP